jgi:ketosteroid isomerase-like protein
MNKIILTILAISIFTACTTSPEKQRYTQDSPEIETFKKTILDYEAGNWQSLRSHYADTAKVFYNVTDEHPVPIDESIEKDKKSTSTLSKYGFDADNTSYEMVLTDDGETWVNFWSVWHGTLSANNQKFETPVHITAQFVDGKIVREHGYWDNSAILLVMRELEANIEKP